MGGLSKDYAVWGTRLRRQGGASAIEFALVLPLLLALSYAVVAYSYTYIVFESINYAAQQGAEAAVSVDPSLAEDGNGGGYSGNVTTIVRNTVAGALGWMPESQRTMSIGANGSNVLLVFCSPGGGGGPGCPQQNTGGSPLVVRINFPITSIFPVLTLPGVGTIPPLPATISGVGVAVLP
ncbi:TadE/TadG family type IV pilus assembly protein [Hydrocarboniphaga effusa]|jgi:Flp pilus assembly protein TadG|uniref:TadE/TadG family type IV pilus assembly protein n=1 Tax=Hydrocarboniphaga effusa TaxID=243629 RepID=UPI003137FFBE